MPEKRDYYSSYGQKLISLFAKLLFSGQSHSLIELSRMLNCSKQTVLRLVDDIRRAYGVDIEESLENRRKYYRIKKAFQATAAVNLTESELQSLYMCRAFAEHLLGKHIYDDATKALEKSHAFLSSKQGFSSSNFGSFVSGSIDYTAHQEHIRTLTTAMNVRKICKVTYKSIMNRRAKSFYIKPLKLFSHRDTINAKMLVVVGNNHILKKLDWQDHVVNKHRSIREYLSEKRRKLRIFSIGQVIGESVYEDDFRREFGPIDGAVAVDLDERFAGWKLGIVQSMAIKPAEVWELSSCGLLLKF